VKTASFRTYTGPGRIGIARWAPRWTPAGYRVFSALAPGRWFNSVDQATYRRRYEREILGRLDPQQTWDQLHELAAGAEPVLLCWEQPPFTESNFCHRRMVATWFRRELGEVVDELQQPSKSPDLF
jgi:hypothetical protein